MQVPVGFSYQWELIFLSSFTFMFKLSAVSNYKSVLPSCLLPCSVRKGLSGKTWWTVILKHSTASALMCWRIWFVVFTATEANGLLLLYLSKLGPVIPRSAMKSLLKLALTNVQFKCNGIWYVQSYGLSMGSSLAVIPASVWMKSFEASLQKRELSEYISRSDQNGKCKDSNRRVTFRRKGEECESCKNWFHARRQTISNEEYANMQDVVWVCTHCSNQQTVGRYEEMKLFRR